MNGCATMHSYEDCEAHFNSLPAKDNLNWKPHQRPLDNWRKPHLRIEKGDGYYDVCLYRTAMARYFKPRSSFESYTFEREVWYNMDPRQASSAFQHWVLGFGAYETMRTTDGRVVHVGRNNSAGGVFPVRLTFVNNKLDVSRSIDAPDYNNPVTSEFRKVQRKRFRPWLKPFEAMAVISDDRSSWMNTGAVRDAYENAGFVDPVETRLIGAIRHRGAKWVVDQVYPLGDIRTQRPHFKEVTCDTY